MTDGKVEVVTMTENQMIMMSGMSSRGGFIAGHMSQASASLFGMDGRVKREQIEQYLSDSAMQHENMASNFRTILSEIQKDGLIVDDVVSEIEDLFKKGKR